MATQSPENGSAAANAELNGIVKQDEAKGRVAVHTFDPEATPQEKASAAGKARDQLKPVNKVEGAGEREVAVDTGSANNVVPTITVSDADVANPKKDDKSKPTVVPTDDAVPKPPGDADGIAPTIPDWYRVGWRSVSGIDAPPLPEGEERDKGVLDMFLSEQMYGSWYHNAALIFFAVFASHFLTRFHFGWGWLFIILAICNTYYSTSMSRVRRRARDDIQRELVKTRLASEHESAEWINHFLDRFWLIYEPVLSATVVSSVDQILSTNTPPFLDSLRLSTFTLGTKAPRIDKVRTFPKTAEDVVMMDWGISFTPNDISDLTPRQAATKVNPKIVLSVRVGKGLATAAMPILLEDLSFTGLLRIRLKLMTNFPHVQTVDISFLEKPVFDYVLKPIGGETFGFDIGNIPGLSAFIRDQTHNNLGPMMYDPNVFTLNLEQLLSGTPLDAAIGVLQVTVQSARSIKASKMGGGSPDPYVGLSINNRAELARTKYKHSTSNPTWTESKFLLVNNLNESLVLTVWDYNDHRKNTELGAATFELAGLLEDATQEGQEKPILKDGKERGDLRFDVFWYPVLKPEVVDGVDVLPETSVGIVRLTIHQAKELDFTKSLSGDLNPFAKVLISGNPLPIHTTSRFKHTNNPVWESATEFLCSDKASSIVSIKVIDDRDFLKDPVVGYMSIKLADLLEAKKEAGRDWWPLSGCKSGRLRLTVEWKPLNMAGSLQAANQYVPPIGVVKLWLQKAVDVKNVEATLGGKSDPYMRVQINNVTKGRTEVINNNLNPEWDQILYIPVHTLRESLLLECMDYQNLTKDRSLGSVELRVSELIEESDDHRYPYKSKGKKTAKEPFRLDKGNVYKGELHYVAEFVPGLALQGVKFDQQPNEIQRAAAGTEDDDGEMVGDDGSSISTFEEETLEITVRTPIGGTKQHKKNAKSTDTTKTASSSKTASSTEVNKVNNEPPKPQGVEMAKEELLKQQSGVVVFNVISGQLAKKARLEVLLDDAYWPAFTTPKARSTNAQWETVGEGFIKEMDFGRVWLRLDQANDDDKDDIIAEWKGDAKEFLDGTLDGVKSFTLTDVDGGSTSTVKIEARYVPVPVVLEPRESINNQGILRVELLTGKDIHGIDRGGKSDPYAVFSLNGQRVFKSQTKKKTLSPEWNESFEVSVSSRVGADFSAEIFDWNQIEQAKSLGIAKIELADIEPFQAAERSVNLVSPKHGEKGSIQVRLMFQPEIIAKSRKNTSTFSTAGRAMTQIGGLPMGAGKSVVHGVTHSITGVFKRDKEHSKGNSQGSENDMPPVPNFPPGQSSQPVGQSPHLAGGAGAATASAFPSTNNGNGSKDPGTLRVTVLSGKDLSTGDIKPYVTLRLGDKEVKTKSAGKTGAPEWNESFTFAAGAFTPKLYAWVHDHKTLGKDKVLGEAEIDIWRHINPNSTSSADVFTELNEGSGQLRLRLEFDADSSPNNTLPRGASMSSIDRSSTIAGSPSRFSIRPRKSLATERDEQ